MAALQSAGQVTKALRENFASLASAEPSAQLNRSLWGKALENLISTFDGKWGGFGGAPKFPPSEAVLSLLREHARTHDDQLLRMVTLTLDKMASGGIYDHLGGGFHRYATDARWLVPHFEKMLYDNALLTVAYTEAYQVTHNAEYRRVAEETLNYVLRDMTDERGGFYSAEDADSEGEEGKFYVWTPEEIKATLGTEDGDFFCAYYDVTRKGNFENQNILNRPHEDAEFAKEQNATPEQLHRRLDTLHKKLLAVRNERARPGRDDKVLASWNGMMISALAKAYQVYQEKRYLEAASKASHFILEAMMRDGRLQHVYSKGHSRIPAYLDDYAHVANALIDMYESTFHLRWIDAAQYLVEEMIAAFWDSKSGGFFLTSQEHTDLPTRIKPMLDSAVPSGNAIAALALLRLQHLLDRKDYGEKAHIVMTASMDLMERAPRAFLSMLRAAEYEIYPADQIAIVGFRESSDTAKLLKMVYGRFLPNSILALLDPDEKGAEAMTSRIPLLANRHMVDKQATAYVCKGYSCRKPVTEPEELTALLDEAAKHQRNE